MEVLPVFRCCGEGGVMPVEGFGTTHAACILLAGSAPRLTLFTVLAHTLRTAKLTAKAAVAPDA